MKGEMYGSMERGGTALTIWNIGGYLSEGVLELRLLNINCGPILCNESKT